MPARNVLASPREPGGGSVEAARRLVVAWQHPEERSIQPVGFLSRDENGFKFSYIRNAMNVRDFRPLLGFEDLDRSYQVGGSLPAVRSACYGSTATRLRALRTEPRPGG